MLAFGIELTLQLRGEDGDELDDGGIGKLLVVLAEHIDQVMLCQLEFGVCCENLLKTWISSSIGYSIPIVTFDF